MDGQSKHMQSGGIPTNLRMLLVLEEISRSGVPVTPTEVNQRIGLPKPTIHRLFSTLEAEGFIMRELDGKSYTPVKRLRRLSTNVLSSLRVRTARLSVLGRLAEDIGETCNIAVPDRDSMVYLDRVETHWPLRIQLPVGTQVPFHCTASGKMYLSTLRPDYLDRFLKNHTLDRQTDKTITGAAALQDELIRTRDRGYSTANEEFMAGMPAIAVPILDNRGRLLSTLSIHAPQQRRDLPDLVEYLEPLRAAADELAAIAGR